MRRKHSANTSLLRIELPAISNLESHVFSYVETNPVAHSDRVTRIPFLGGIENEWVLRDA